MKYVEEVAELFRLRFPKVAILGPEDYTAIADWEKREIPIEIVERSLDEVSEICSEITSIIEIEETVKRNFRESLQQVPM